ncbi:MAG: hypothetical protein E6K76_00640, partial [Candidatus Eisenbacteria bacterium]
MPAERALRLFALAGWIMSSAPSAARAAPPAIPDSARAAPPARVAARIGVTVEPKLWIAAPIDMTVERTLGIASLEDALRLRRPLLLTPLPLFG